MDLTLDEGQQAVRDLSRRILGDLSAPRRLAGLDSWMDREAWHELAQAGLLGVALPESAGGGGLGFLGAHLLLEEVGAAASPVPLWETIVLGALPIAHLGSAQQRDTWLPGVMAGTTLLTAALGEDVPGDALQPRTRATREPSGWQLDGAKATVPLAPLADALLIPAATEDGHSGVWIVPRDAAGLTLREQEVITGAPSADVVLERVRVGDDSLLGPADSTALPWLFEHATAGLASLTSGWCRAVVRMSADHTSRREQFGRPIATFQAVAQRVADAYIDAEAVELTSLQAAWRLTEGLPASDEVAIAKWWAAEAGHRVIHAAHHVHGGVGVDREYPLHRYFAAVKHHEFLLGGGTTQLLRIGASLAAEPA